MPQDLGVAGHGTMTAGFAYLGCRAVHHYTLATVKEMAPIIIAAIICDHSWKGAQVSAFCDNSAVVAALNNWSCKEKHVMQMLKVLFIIETHHQFKIITTHVAEANNTLADHYAEINLDYSFPCMKQHNLNRLMLILLSYSGFWTPNKIGHHQLGLDG